MNKVKNFKEFGAANFALLRKDMMDALAKVGEQYGIEFKAGGIGYSDNYFTCKVTAAVVGEGGESITREAESFQQLAHLFGMKADQLFKVVKLMGHDYKIIGLNSRSSRLPIILKEVSTGRAVKAAAESVVSAITKNGLK